MGRNYDSGFVQCLSCLLFLSGGSLAPQAAPAETKIQVLDRADPLLRPPYMHEAGPGKGNRDMPGQLEDGAYGRHQGVALDSGRILLWTAGDFGRVNGRLWLWDSTLARSWPILVDPNARPPKQPLGFMEGQVFVDQRPVGRPVRFDSFTQAWVNEVPEGFNWIQSQDGWPHYPLPGGWILGKDRTPGGAHAWELIEQKTGLKRALNVDPLTGRGVGRSDGRIVLLSGKQTQILDPQTGTLSPGPAIGLSTWSEMCVIPGDKVLFAGGAVQTRPIPKEIEGELDGYEGYFDPVRGLYEMDLFTFKVRRVALLRYERIRNFAMIPTPDGKLLIAGGTYGWGPNGSSPRPEVEFLDLKTYRDEVRFRLLADRKDAIARELKNGKVMMIGGRMNGPYHQRNLVSAGTAELFDPATGTTVGLREIPPRWEPISILEDGQILLGEFFVSKWPIKLMLFNPVTAQTMPAGELKTSIPQCRFQMAQDRILFFATTDPNKAEEFATAVEAWDPVNGVTSLNINTYKHLHALCALKDGRLLFQGVGPGKKTTVSTLLFDPGLMTVRPTAQPAYEGVGSRGVQLRDGRVLLSRGWGWTYNRTLNKGLFLWDGVWDPRTEVFSAWPTEFIETMEDKVMKRHYTFSKVSFDEVAGALCIPGNDPGVIESWLHPAAESRGRMVLKDGRVMFILGSGVSFLPGRNNSSEN